MASHFYYFVKFIAPSVKYAKYNLISKLLTYSNKIPVQFYSKSLNPSSDSDIVDVNIDTIMTEDDEFASNYNYEPEPDTTASTDLNGTVMAPIDVNPWVDEELEKEGTVEMEYIDKEIDEIHYPEPPEDRSGHYEFEGIKIWLPKRMLSPATYRYRLTEEEKQTLPDDIRICKFEKFKPAS